MSKFKRNDNTCFFKAVSESNHRIIYAFAEGDEAHDCSITYHLLEDWLNFHEHVLPKHEDGTFKIRVVQENPYDDCGRLFPVSNYSICNYGKTYFTNYELLYYQELFQYWYKMYQTVVVATQILPNVLQLSLPDIMVKFEEVADGMYREINSYESFLCHLNTDYIKKHILIDPQSVIYQLNYQKNYGEELRNLYQYQLEKLDKFEKEAINDGVIESS